MSSPVPSILKETELLLLQREKDGSYADPKKNLRSTGKMSQSNVEASDTQNTDQNTSSSIMTEIPISPQDQPKQFDAPSFPTDNFLSTSPAKPTPITISIADDTRNTPTAPGKRQPQQHHSTATQTFSRPPVDDEVLHEYFSQRRGDEELGYDTEESVFVSMSRFFFCFSLVFFLILVTYGGVVWYADYNTPTFLFYFMMLLIIGFLTTLAVVKMFQVRTRRYLYPDDSTSYDVVDAVLFISLFFFLVGSFAAYGLDNSFFLYFSLILVVLIVVFFIIQIATAVYGTAARQAEESRQQFDYQRI